VVAVEVWQAARPKGRPARWAFRVTAGGEVIFKSAWVDVRYADRGDAEWLAGLIDRLAARGAFAGCPGHPGQVGPVLWWGPLDFSSSITALAARHGVLTDLPESAPAKSNSH
jgi:hypothetical protein